MAQKSIKSFFTVQKKKIEETRDNVTEDKTKTPEKKCDLANGKSPIGKGEQNEVDSPIASGKRKTRKLVLSSDEEEEENMSPKSSAGSSKSLSPDDKKPVRKKQIRGASALKEIEAKRAAKKARLEVSSTEVKPKEEKVKSEEVEKTSDTEEMETDAPDSSTKEKATSPAKEEKSVPPVKDESPGEVSSSVRNESPEREKSPAKVEKKSSEKEKSPSKKPSPVKEKSPTKVSSPVKAKSPKKEKSPDKEAAVTSDFSDDEAKPTKESPPAKKGKGAAKTAAKKKSPAVSKKPVAKKSPAVDKKAPAEKKTSSAFSSFFTPKGGKKEEGGKKEDSEKGGETLGIAKETETSGYNPAKSKYHPIDDASWERGKPVPYLALARTLECIEETSARLKIADILSNFLRSVIVLSPDNLIPSIYLCLNKLAPAFEGLELGLAERSLMKAVAQSSGRSEKQTMEELEETGDLGIVAQNSCGKQRKLFHPPPLTVAKVFSQLKDLAAMKGKDAMSRKQDKIVAMYNACKPIEARYLIRSLNGKLRIGLAEQTVLQAIALACVNTPPGQEFPPPIIEVAKKMSTEAFQEKLKEQALILKTTYCECPIYEKIVPVLLEHGIEGLPEHCQISPGVPLRPMLAHPTKGVADVLARFDGRKFTCEWKYDGERAQIHFNATQKTVRIFSRNQEDNTSKFPEVVSRLSSQLSDDVKECILDCEAVGWDRENSRILPFQVLSTRKKKDANEADIKVQVCLFVFDLLYVNGEPLVKVPLEERRKKLREVVKEVPGQMQFADFLDTDNVDEVQEYLEQSIKGNCEGLMVKTLQEEATYEIAKRSRNWLKLKKDYLEGVGDTLDLVVIGGYLGRGKRAGVYGGFLLACYDPETEQYQSICKIGTGFSDESLQQHSEFFKPHILSGGARSYYHCDPSLSPDHWFDAVQVWEVKCADLSLSPIYKAALGIVDSEKGISLRFPRFLRIRDDKKVEEATAAAQVAELYQSQEQVKNQTDGKTFNEEDYY